MSVPASVRPATEGRHRVPSQARGSRARAGNRYELRLVDTRGRIWGAVTFDEEGKARIARDNRGRAAERLFADVAIEHLLSPAPGGVFADVRRRLLAFLNSRSGPSTLQEFTVELEQIQSETRSLLVHELPRFDEESAQSAWYPGNELVAEREAILTFGGEPPLSAQEAMSLLGITTRQGLAKRRRTRSLLGLPLGERRIVYPRWQFTRRGTLIPGLETVLAAAPTDDPWGIADLLTSPQSTLGGREPVTLLREKGEAAINDILPIFERTYA